MSNDIKPMNQTMKNPTAAEKAFLLKTFSRPGKSFASPTDEILSPCSQKLSDHKSRFYKKSSKPTKLIFSNLDEE